MLDTLHVHGAGIVTDGYLDIRDFARDANAPSNLALMLDRARPVDPARIEPHDALAQLAIAAAHQALTMARIDNTPPERIGLIFSSAWGLIDSTVGYLESMLDKDGKYASPRHFARSVYSAGASVLAIEFGIKGPCTTLAFDENTPRGQGAVVGAIRQAARFLAAKRCDRVLLVWADQNAEIAEDLVRRGSEKMGLHEYDRFVTHGNGHGAVAIVLGANAAETRPLALPIDRDSLNLPLHRGKPFACDAAVSLLRSLFGSAAPHPSTGR